MGADAVVLGSALTVIGAVVIVAYLWVKIRALMDEDAKKNK